MSIARLFEPPSVPRSWMTPSALHSTACCVAVVVLLVPTTCPTLLIATAPALCSGSVPGRRDRRVGEDPAATKPRLPVAMLTFAVPTTTPASLMSFPHIVVQQPVMRFAPVPEDHRNALKSFCRELRTAEPVTWPAAFNPIATPV